MEMSSRFETQWYKVPAGPMARTRIGSVGAIWSRSTKQCEFGKVDFEKENEGEREREKVCVSEWVSELFV